MTITSITIENFKGIKDPVQIKFKPITLLFGPNSAGKSTIIQALHYAKEVLDRENVDPGHTKIGGKSTDLGGFESLVNEHDKKLSIRIRFDLDLSKEDLPDYLDEYDIRNNWHGEAPQLIDAPYRSQTAWAEFSVRWSEILRRPLINRYAVGANGEELAEISTSPDGRQISLTEINPFNPVFLKEGKILSNEQKKIALEFLGQSESSDREEIGDLSEQLIRIFLMIHGDNDVPETIRELPLSGQSSALPRWGKTLGIDLGILDEDIFEDDRIALEYGLSSLIVGPGELVRDALKRICYIGPIREIPPRNFEPEKSPDSSRWSTGLKGWDILHNSEKNFVNRLNRWLTEEDRLNSGYSIEVKRFREIGEEDPISILMRDGVGLEEMEMIQDRINGIPIKSRVFIREENTGVELMPQDVGVGISQTLPVIVGALHVQEGIFAIEQPELHIHPALQVALGDLFISRIQESQICFLLETHSEHLMLRFLRRIRETDEGSLPPGKDPIRPDQLAVYYIEQGGKGVSVLPIRISEDGEFIDNWPKGFFEEREEELLY
jgi:hypothetical protein